MAKIYNFEKIEPKGVLSWFKKICAIPHGSFNEKALLEMLKNYLIKANCKIKTFKTGAFLAFKNATKGFEKFPCVMLQSHTDMILAKDSNVKIDLNKQAIKPYYDTVKKWLKAEGTTLGADNGIGIAMMMEVLTNEKIIHGPIECLFTTNEEVDPSICLNAIPNGIFKSTQIINLDCDNEKVIYIGSGAFNSLNVTHKINLVPIKKNTKTYTIDMNNFTGGHSGLEIHNSHINVIKLVSRALNDFSKCNDISIASWNSGTAPNSIPKFSKINVQIQPAKLKLLTQIVKKQLEREKIIVQNRDNNATLKITLSKQQAKKVISNSETAKIFAMFSTLPNGMFNYSKMSKCMFNSSNIGLLNFSNNLFKFTISSRSFIDEDCRQIVDNISQYLNVFGINEKEIKKNSKSASWLVVNPNQSSLINIWKKNFIKVYHCQPDILSTPGGLEIAEIIKKAPKMQKNSLACGPKILYPHTPSECCTIDSIQKVWKILTLTLSNIRN